MSDRVANVLVPLAVLADIAVFVCGLYALPLWTCAPGSLAEECRNLVADGRTTADLWATGAVPEELSGCGRPTFYTASSTRGVVITCEDGRRWLVEVQGVWRPKLGKATEIREGGL